MIKLFRMLDLFTILESSQTSRVNSFLSFIRRLAPSFDSLTIHNGQKVHRKEKEMFKSSTQIKSNKKSRVKYQLNLHRE